MTRRLQFVTLVVAVSLVPAIAGAQDYTGSILPPPPVPTGPPLVVPATHIQPTWVENGNVVLPAGATEGLPIADAAWPVAGVRSGSACRFDGPDGSNGIFPNPSSFQVLMGAYYSSRFGPGIPSFNYVPITLRQAWKLGNSLGANAPTVGGDWEFLTDVTGSAITSRYGSYFAGASFLLRYNWTESGSFLMPYSQVGAGGVYNDAYRDQTQRAIGEAFEFILHAEVGLKCFIVPNLSLDIEGGFQHLSNGGLASRNAGVNALGGQVGFTYYFGGGS